MKKYFRKTCLQYTTVCRHCTQQSCTSSVRRVHCARQKAHIVATCTLVLRENKSSKGMSKNAKGWQGQGRAGTANLIYLERKGGMEAPNALEGASIDG